MYQEIHGPLHYRNKKEDMQALRISPNKSDIQVLHNCIKLARD